MAVLKKTLLIAGIALAALVAAAALAYAIGMVRTAGTVPPPVTETVPPPVTEAAPVASTPSTGAGAVTETRQVPPPDPNSPLATAIPGCVCHSDDPKLVAEHAEYRMNQCFGCHDEGVPTGQD